MLKIKDIKTVAVIGLGLMGGSMALALKKLLPVTIYGIDQNDNHLLKALELNLIDHQGDMSIIPQCDMVIVAIPVDKIVATTLKVLDHIADDCLVFDTGSLKEKICLGLQSHPKRGNFVAVHPIAGTEYSGPEAAIPDLYKGKKNIICNADMTRTDILNTALDIFNLLHMQTSMMNSAEHDKHIAYVSHLSHISSFMLGKTVLEIEKDDKNIFNMAGSGFASTVRLAKSSPDTWTPIFIENKQYILKSLDEYIKNLKEIYTMIDTDDYADVYKVIKDTNHIKDVLDRK